ncbi:SET and MYND domain-containing protein 4 isoform X2 [Diachasma alloeum]|uniref:SET and MYND domain-containing protein 4 isoform X2 n=1 Tax=Diachasma alloeum TaxID=454923 RepID=UPI0007383758|nr:SET and MYND domain-containing protein 4 isoform X2 [Diachasma alloeum]
MLLRDAAFRVERLLPGLHRGSGIQYCRSGENKKALILLSQAVLRAPMTGRVKAIDEGYSLALALVARADVLIALGEFQRAVDDLRAAGEEQLPNDFRAQIDSKLKELDERLEDVHKAVKILGPARRDQYCKPIPPQLTDGPNPEFPGLSRLVEIRESPDVGRHAVAAGDVRVGDTLATEPPLASCLLPDYYGTHCHHCFVRLRAPMGCPHCSTVAFCGVGCRNEAMESYHKYECKVLALFIGSGMSILSTLALRMVTQVGLQTCLKLHRKCKEIAEFKTTRNELESQSEASAKPEGGMSKSAKRRLRKKKLLEHSQQMKGTGDVDFRAYELVTHESMRSPSDFFERTLMAAFLLKCLMTVDFFGSTRASINSPTDEEITIGSLLLRNLQLLQFNAHEIFETRSGNEHRFRGNKTVYLGIAIYASVARFNHDCYPAVTRYFTGRDIVIRATRPLKPGEVVAENYGPIFMKRSLKERQRVLSGRYWFKCTCRACTENWPDFDGLVDYSTRLRCTTEGCRGSLHRLKNGNPSIKCTTCQRKINLKERIARLEECEEEYKRGFTSMEEEKSDEALRQVAQALEKFHMHAWPPHRDTHLAEIALAACMAENGNAWKIFTE